MIHEVRARRGVVSLATIAAVSLVTACSGGGGGAPSIRSNGGNPAPATVAPSATASLAMTFSGKSGASVTVSARGSTVASGTLDANGNATLVLASSIARGSTVTATSGGIAATFVLAFATPKTVATVTDNGNGTITVSAHDANGGENQNVTEDRGGNPSEVDDGDMAALPANLPVAIVASCTQLSLAATSAQIAFIDLEEKASDGDSDGNAEIRVTGLPFSTTANDPLVEPVVAGAARIEVRLYDAAHQEVLRVRGPIGSFTALANGGASPAPCPSVSASASASASATASPSAQASQSPQARASESPEPGESESPEPRESGSPVPRESESPEPGQSASPSPSPSASSGGGPGPH